MARNSTLINKLIYRIGRRDTLMRQDIHNALVECALHAMEDRNVDPAIRLFKAVGNSVNRKGMSKWLSLNACIHFKDDAPMLSDIRQKAMAAFSVEEKTTYIASLSSGLKWYEFAKETNTATNLWDHDRQLGMVLDYVDNMSKRAKKANDAALGKTMSELAAILTKEISAIKAAAEAALIKAD